MKFPAKPKVIRKIRVRSFTKKSEFYVVEIWSDGDFTCECPASIYHPKTPCKHIIKAQKFLVLEKIKEKL